MNLVSVQRQVILIAVTCCVALVAFIALGVLQSRLGEEFNSREDEITEIESASFQASSALTRLTLHISEITALPGSDSKEADQDFESALAILDAQLAKMESNTLDASIRTDATIARQDLEQLRELHSQLAVASIAAAEAGARGGRGQNQPVASTQAAQLAEYAQTYAEKVGDLQKSKDRIWGRIRDLEAQLETEVSDVATNVTWALLALATLAVSILLTVSFRAIHTVKKQNQLVANTNQRFRDFAHSTADVFWEMDARGIITDLEADNYQFLLKREDIVGKSVSQILANQELRDPTVGTRYKAMLHKGEPFRDFTYAVRGPDGDWLWRTISAVPVRDETGKPIGFRGSILDQTARFRAEEHVSELIGRYQALAKASQETFVTISPVAVITSIDGFQQNAIRKLQAEFIGVSISTWFTHAKNPNVAQTILEHIAHRRPFKNVESLARNYLTSTPSWYRVSGAPLIDNSGEYKGYVLGFVNIDAVKQAEAEALRVNAQLDQLLRSTPGVMFRWIGNYGRARFENLTDSVFQICGYTVDELKSMPNPTLTLDEDIERSRENVKKMLAEKGAYERKVRIRHKNGHTLWVLEKGVLVGHTEANEPIFDVLMLNMDHTAQAEERAYEITTALDQVDDAVSINDKQNRVIHCNRAMINLIDGQSADDLLGKTPFEIVRLADPTIQKSVSLAFRDAQRERKPWHFEFAAITKTGHRKFLEGTVSFPNENRIISMIRDVTDRVIAEQRKQTISDAIATLARDEQIASGDTDTSFQRICEILGKSLNLARAGVWLLEDDGQNLICADLYESNIDRHSFGVQIPVSSHEAYFEALRAERVIVADDARNHRATACFTADYLEPLGITSALKAPIRLGSRVAGVICCEHVGPKRKWASEEITFAMIVADIAAHAIEAGERRAVQDRLAETVLSHDQIASAVNQARDAIMIVSKEARVVYANPSMVQLLGFERGASLIGKDPADVLVPLEGRREDHQRRMEQSFAESGRYDLSLPIRLPSGDARHIAGYVMLLPDGGRIALLTDQSEQLAAQRQREKLNTQLAQAKKMEAIGSLAGGIAHDFNNIVAATRSFAELIQQDTDISAGSRNYSARIIKTCDRAADLVREIMVFARAGTAEHEAIDISALIDDLLPLTRGRIPETITFQVNTSAKPISVLGNSAQLLQVVLNLCINAADAVRGNINGRISLGMSLASNDHLQQLKPGLEKITARDAKDDAVWRYVLGAVRNGVDYVRISVVDNGSGVKPEHMERVFEPFFTTKDRSRGTGLGLAIVASVMTAHNGVLAMSSSIGRGTTIDLFIPLTTTTTAHLGVERGKYRSPSLIGSERVLLIDDEVDLADALSISLSTLGYETLTVNDPEEAIELFKEDPSAWDIVISDQIMPKMQGLEVIQRLKAIRPSIKVLLYTGFSEAVTDANAKAAGASAFLQKPVSAEVIARTIRTVVSEAEQQTLLLSKLEPVN